MTTVFATPYEKETYKCQGCTSGGYCTRDSCFKVGSDFYCTKHVHDYADIVPELPRQHRVLSMTRTTRAKLYTATAYEKENYPCQCSRNCKKIVNWKIRGELYCDSHICEYVDTPTSHSQFV